MKTRLLVSTLILFSILIVCLLIPSCKESEKEMVVQTGTVSEILTASAKVSGKVIDLGKGIREHGHCYALTQNPTLSNMKTELGPPVGIGDFISTLTGLQAGTKYYVKAYIRNDNEVVYGKEITFTTNAGFSVTTTAVTSVASAAAKCGGTVVDDGGLTVTGRGICWSTNANPTISDSHTNDGSGKGSYTSDITGLSSGYTYYVRAYATNSSGTVYGDQFSFLTLVSDIDGNMYKTVLIGTQVWMAENLRTTHYRDGTAIPNITGNTEWHDMGSAASPGAYCNYNNTVSAEYENYITITQLTI